MCWKEEWENIIFSDEKKFNLDGPDGFSYYWHDLSKKKGSVMFWGAFSCKGKLPLSNVPSKMNANMFTQILENLLGQYLERYAEMSFTFQQDNAPVHSAKITKQWFLTKNLSVLDWPSLCPDLSPWRTSGVFW